MLTDVFGIQLITNPILAVLILRSDRFRTADVLLFFASPSTNALHQYLTL